LVNKIDSLEKKIKIMQSDHDIKVNEYESYIKDYEEKKKVRLIF
jgi:hypothetical protein